MKHIIPIFAFLVLLGFLGILLYKVPRLDLGLLLGLTMVFAAFGLRDMLRGR